MSKAHENQLVQLYKLSPVLHQKVLAGELGQSEAMIQVASEKLGWVTQFPVSVQTVTQKALENINDVPPHTYHRIFGIGASVVFLLRRASDDQMVLVFKDFENRHRIQSRPIAKWGRNHQVAYGGKWHPNFRQASNIEEFTRAINAHQERK